MAITPLSNISPPPDDLFYKTPPPIPKGLKIPFELLKQINDEPKLKQKNYVPKDVLDNLRASLDVGMLDKLPYDARGGITFENLIVFLSKKDNQDIKNAITDEQIIDEQIDILFDIKNEAKKAAQDGQTSSSRQAKSNYIRKRLNIFDELANKASFNNRSFNRVKSDLKTGAIKVDNISNSKFTTDSNILEPGKVSLVFLDSNYQKVNIREVEIGSKFNTGLGVLSEAINDDYDKLKIKASWSVISRANDEVQAGAISNFIINDIKLGTINDVMKYDMDGKLVAAINNLRDLTGVNAGIDKMGHLVLESRDGRGIVVEGEGMDILSLDTQAKNDNDLSSKHSNYGKLILMNHNTNDINMVDNESSKNMKLSNKASFNNRVKNDLKIGVTRSDNIGNTRFATGSNILEPGKVSLVFLDSNNKKVNIKEVEIDNKVNTGLKVLSEVINNNYDRLNIKASWSVISTASDVVQAGDIFNFTINDITVGDIEDIKRYDMDGKLVASINNLTSLTGVKGSTDARGHLVLTSIDGRGIVVEGKGMDILSLDTQSKNDNDLSIKHSNYGKLTLVKHNSNDINMVDNESSKHIGFSKDEVSESTIHLRYFKGSNYNEKEFLSIGSSPNDNSLAYQQIKNGDKFPSTVSTYQSSLTAIDVIDSSILQLKEIKNTLNTNIQSPIYQEQKINKGSLVSQSI